MEKKQIEGSKSLGNGVCNCMPEVSEVVTDVEMGVDQ